MSYGAWRRHGKCEQNMNNPQILIIDSNKMDAKALVSFLQSEGYHTLVASNGEQGLIEINETPIALVVLDHENLPDRGLEIIQEIVDIDPALQLIIHSRDNSFNSAVEALRKRAADYLQKPCADEFMLGAVELALNQRTKQLRRAQYYEQVDYLWARIKHLDEIDMDDDNRNEVLEARFIAINPSTMVDLEKQAILHKGKTVPLSRADLRLLCVFLNNPRQILSFQDIILLKDSVDVPAKEAQAKLRIMIHRLRLRLSDIPGAEEWIESVRGIGYMFNS